ncbi:recombinase family protein (plasmid) [Clostridium perfringens]
MIYGYARVSTTKQNFERQINNIKSVDPKAKIFMEKKTGTKLDVRKEFNKLLSMVKEGDTIIFDSVSRMSRNAEEGFNLYQDLFNKGVELIFIKESYVNTSVYKNALNNNIALTGTTVDSILKGVNEYLMLLAKEQIKIAFEQSEKEVNDLHDRISEGMNIARENGKRIGRQKGDKVKETKKVKEAKKVILKHSKKFNGTLNDKEVMAITKIAKATFYRLVKELREEEE